MFVAVTLVNVALVPTSDVIDASAALRFVVVVLTPVAFVQIRPVVVAVPNWAFQRNAAEPNERTISVEGKRSVLKRPFTVIISAAESPKVVFPLKTAVLEAPKNEVALIKLPTAPPNKVSVAVALEPRFVTLSKVSTSVEVGQFVPVDKHTL